MKVRENFLHREAMAQAVIVLGASLLCVLGGAPSTSAEEADKLAFFESRIRPVLVEHCYSCHSVGAKEVKGSLVVDTAAGLMKGGDSGPALVAGQPEESLLLAALRYDGMEMPPAGRLPDNVIQDFEKWIALGAPDPRAGDVAHGGTRTIDIELGRLFWAFTLVQDHPVPAVSNRDWPRSNVDAFVLSKLEANQLQPTHDADPQTLVRRLYYDLLGLPPTPDELAAVLRDSSSKSIETLVDQLLESPQFGMHWGRHWLDVARYADSNGGDFNATFHDAWRYRDYVVEAMNRDKPFDQFIREQIAGDLLPYDSDAQRAEQLIASGFLMIGTKMLSERDKVKLQMDVVDEQVSAVGTAFLGMTLGCARCHDHKFDPIPTSDYYAMAGIFRSTRNLEGESQRYVSTWPRSPLPTTPEHLAAVTEHDAKTKAITSQLAAAKKQLDAAETRLKELSMGEQALTVDDVAAEVAGVWKPSTYTPNFVGQGYLHDDNVDKGEKSVEFKVQLPKSATYEVRLSYTAAPGRAKNVPVAVRHAEGETEVTLDQTTKPTIKNLFASIGRFRFDQNKPASVTIFTTGTQGHVIADAVQFVELDSQDQPVIAAGNADTELARGIQGEVEQRKAEVVALDQQLQELSKQAPPPLPLALAVADASSIDDCEICIRGEHRNLGAKVPRGFLQVAAPSQPVAFSKSESGRRELAEWIASPEHPLTPRVIVNRVWMYLLGEGLVRTVDNFGELGERPTHPELLDHLAHRFVSRAEDTGLGWSMKKLVREIVLSRTYQLSSEHDEAAWQVDPENRLLWRAHRRRLPAEALRDAMLSISGTLDLSPGDSPVLGLGVLVNNNSADADTYQRQESQKRSLYLPIIRSELPATLSVFDFADPDLVVGKRAVTNVPAQALLLMNSPFVMDCAQRTATRLVGNASLDREALVGQAYLAVLSRLPTDVELERAWAFLATNEPTEGVAPAIDTQRLAQFIHVLFASTEFRLLD